MNRRNIIIASGVSAIAPSTSLAPRAALAQAPRKVWRIGYLSPLTKTRHVEAAELGLLVQGLREYGYTEGRDYVIEGRYADDDAARLPALAVELVRAGVDLIVSPGTQSTLASQKATSTIPIVVLLDADPVANGFAISLARPGKNLTGFSTQFAETAVKNIEMMKALVPKLARAAVLTNPSNGVLHERMLGSLKPLAQKLGVQLTPFAVSNPAGFEPAFAAMRRERMQCVLVILPDGIFRTYGAKLAELALQQRLPAAHFVRDFPEAGGLMSYGAKIADNWRLGAKFIDKIFKGGKPAEMPFEQPTLFDVVVNLKTAKALGLKVPEVVLIQATKVIE